MEETTDQKCGLTVSDLNSGCELQNNCPFCEKLGVICMIIAHGASPDVAAAKQSKWNTKGMVLLFVPLLL